MVLPTIASVPAPVLFFAGFLVLLAFLGAFALRLADLEDDPEYYEEVGPDGKARVAFQFPPHETREERRKRWARALRRRFWPGLAPGPRPDSLHPHCQPDKEADLFLQALLAACSKPSGPTSSANCQAAELLPPRLPSFDDFDPDFITFQPALIAPPPPPPPPPAARVPPDEARKIRKKIFSVVMSAGPPKALPPITEEDLLAVDQPDSDLEAGPPGSGRVLIGRASLPPQLHAAWQAIGRSRRKMGSGTWAEVDSEPIMTVGSVSATRSVLWAALRKLEELELPALEH